MVEFETKIVDLKANLKNQVSPEKAQQEEPSITSKTLLEQQEEEEQNQNKIDWTNPDYVKDRINELTNSLKVETSERENLLSIFTQKIGKLTNDLDELTTNKREHIVLLYNEVLQDIDNISVELEGLRNEWNDFAFKAEELRTRTGVLGTLPQAMGNLQRGLSFLSTTEGSLVTIKNTMKKLVMEVRDETM